MSAITRRPPILILATLLAGLILSDARADGPGDYLGQAPPDTLSRLFAPDLVSTGLSERDATFLPDGSEFYYTIWLPSRSGVIMCLMRTEQGWSAPKVAPFSGRYSDLEPFVTPDGQRLYFASKRPLTAGGPPKDYDIWYVERSGNAWGEPQNPGQPVNTEKNEFFPTLTRDGVLYLTAQYGEEEEIFRAELVEGVYAQPQRLPEPVNTGAYEFNAMIAADESYIIFTSYGREDDRGGGDLYISFRDATGVWGTARNLGPRINSSALDYCPGLSPDGRYFFFTSGRVRPVEYFASYEEILLRYSSPRNGNDDIFWISSDFIEIWKSQ